MNALEQFTPEQIAAMRPEQLAHLAGLSSGNGNGDGHRNGNGNGDYVEDPDYGTLFHRPDNSGKQPQFTGNGVLSPETLEAIKANGGEFQIAGWGGHTKSGTKRMRVHIEPPYKAEENGGEPTAKTEQAEMPF